MSKAPSKLNILPDIQTDKKYRGHIAAPKKTYFYLEEEDKDDPLVPSMPNLIAFLCHLR